MRMSFQELIEPEGTCFGCGAAHPDGLHIRSYWSDDGTRAVATIMPSPCYVGWPGLVYGGFIAMLVDCHSNWTSIAWRYRAEGREPGTLPKIDSVTGTLSIKYIAPTPMGVPLHLSAWVEGELGRKARVLCEVYAEETLTALGDSIFVRVDAAALADKAHGTQRAE